MLPTLLIFIVGPGGAHPLEEGEEARPRTLCTSGAVSCCVSPPSLTRARDPEALGCGSAGWAPRLGGPPGAKGSQCQQAGTCLQREAGGGQGGWRPGFPEACSPKPEGKACATGLPTRLPGAPAGRAALPRTVRLGSTAKGRPALASAPPPQPCQGPGAPRPAKRPLHCEPRTCLLNSRPALRAPLSGSPPGPGAPWPELVFRLCRSQVSASCTLTSLGEVTSGREEAGAHRPTGALLPTDCPRVSAGLGILRAGGGVRAPGRSLAPFPMWPGPIPAAGLTPASQHSAAPVPFPPSLPHPPRGGRDPPARPLHCVSHRATGQP